MKLGISPLGHDASVAVIDKDKIVFAAQSERYSRWKNDSLLHPDLIEKVLSYDIDEVVYCERPTLKKTRQLYSRQYTDMFKSIKRYLKNRSIPTRNLSFMNHHETHAKAGYYTSGFSDACIVCIDAIGEWDTITIWDAEDTEVKLIYSVKYPHSLGLFYSAFTQRCGLKPNEEEYIMMGMASFGSRKYVSKIESDLIDMDDPMFKLRVNLHKGVGSYLEDAKIEDIAASVQNITEKYIWKILHEARRKTNRDNLVYGGGVALNCVANRYLHQIFKNVWIMPNPGDSGNPLGISGRLKWEGPYLGHNIDGEYPVDELLKELLKGNIVGVANGKAEFGPRAFGNRSLLADPRLPDMKDKVNQIKKREQFRPFAPAVMEEHAPRFFVMGTRKSSPYMQYTFPCNYSKEVPAVVHVDGTSRIQTVNREQNEGFYELLKQFYEKTGCPVLLNTSLNIKGQPLVNSRKEAKDFEVLYDIKVF